VAISLNRVSMNYADESGRDALALSDISFDIVDGDFVVVLGASGCGKTTLLKLIAGFLRPTAGHITANGRTIEGPSAERGVVFQTDALFPWFNVRDNVAFSQRLRGIGRQQRLQSAERLLALVGLDGFGEHKIWQLSGGMRQRVGLARALSAEPALLLMDEPFGALDALTREDMQELALRLWARSAKAMFLITHSLEEAIFLATRLIVLTPRPGRIAETLELGFGRRFAAGASARSIKADPSFIAARQHVAATVFTKPFA
jgi:taurine transport system ATP-binding protein